MFSFIKNSLKTIYDSVTTKLHSLWKRTTIDDQLLEELTTILLEADVGVKTTDRIIAALEQQAQQGTITTGTDLRSALKELLNKELALTPPDEGTVFLLVGVNGSGKTTFASKLAHRYEQQGKRVLLVAADTFRAAAPEQLAAWAQTTGAALESGAPQQDPASVVFAGCQRFIKDHFDILIIDTAGRLQTKVNLMKELEKIRRVISKALPSTHITTLLTLDAMLGQNSLDQARLFNESTQVNGIVLTKMDGTGKGGIVFSISRELHIPVAYLSYGEHVENLKPFNAHEYIDSLL